MNIQQALGCLGATRVIWIDDHFADSPAVLGKMLALNLETTRECGFTELEQALQVMEIDEVQGVELSKEAVTAATPARRAEMLAKYLEVEDAREPGKTKELLAEDVQKVCDLLGIMEADRWSFESCMEKAVELCEAGDEHIVYVIDLKDSNGPPNDTTGLEVVKVLHDHHSKSTAFILTHEADNPTEAETEEKLLKALKADDVTDIPLCVISKDRLSRKEEDSEDIEEALRIAIKRAGVRRNIHEVMLQAKSVVQSSFDTAMEAFTRISPEQIEKYAVNKAYREGVSETHVIERAVTAHLSKGLRTLFATNARARQVAQRLRTLRSIPLVGGDEVPDNRLADFHMAEVWETAQFVNTSFSQLACGDVFQVTPGKNKPRFVLLAPPCDIALRNDGTRVLKTAVFAPLVKVSAETPDGDSFYHLPFKLDDKRLCCDLKHTAPVRLSTLDLATLRADGLVKVDHDQEKPDGLMDGQGEIYAERTEMWQELSGLSKGAAKGTDKMHEEELQLVFAAPDAFNSIKSGKLVRSKEAKAAVWPLVRSGRIRMPYASAILNRYASRLNRQAFEINYLDVVDQALEGDNPDTAGVVEEQVAVAE